MRRRKRVKSDEVKKLDTVGTASSVLVLHAFPIFIQNNGFQRKLVPGVEPFKAEMLYLG